MFNNFNNKEHDPSSGRAILRDIIPKARKQKGPPPQAPAKIPVSKKSPSLYWSAGAVLVFTLAVFLLDNFSYALVTITPRQEFVEINSGLRASSGGLSDLPLEVITFEEIISKTGAAATLKKIEERSRGRVVIFNAFSSAPQKLVAGTRLEAPGGRIYRLTSEVTVPGAKVEDGKIVPQGTEVEMAADRAGEEYNLGLSDFTIPGFKGTPKFEKFYGRSQTELTGGFVGTAPVVSDADVKNLTAAAQNEFASALESKIKTDLPEGVFMPEGAWELKTAVESVAPPVGARGEQVTVKVKGTLKALAVRERDFFGFLGRSYLSVRSPEEISIVNFSELSVRAAGKDFEAKTLNLSVKGRAHFVWEFDEENLKNDLIAAGDRQTAFTNYGAIERAQIEFKPFFWRIFPKDPSRIRVEKILKTP